uniref:Uncharacterized protein n=1 Tax=Romanomermis culicivorax TaxID=13658 RepID=A0A915JE44_ROMCU
YDEHRSIQEFLNSTGNKNIIELVPDCFWGIGFSLDSLQLQKKQKLSENHTNMNYLLVMKGPTVADAAFKCNLFDQDPTNLILCKFGIIQ